MRESEHRRLIESGRARAQRDRAAGRLALPSPDRCARAVRLVYEIARDLGKLDDPESSDHAEVSA